MTCLDTSFIIDLLRGRKSAATVLENLEDGGESIYVAAPSIMELARGVYLALNINEEKKNVNDLLNSLIVLNLDRESAFRAGEIDAELEGKGEKIGSEDIMIAAIALQNEETLVTGNKKHFERIKGLNIVSYVKER